jgi:hypothetical protein
MALRKLPAFLFLAALTTLPGSRATAQVLPAAAGLVGGFVAGTMVTTGTVVLEARLGRYIYGMGDFLSVRPELLPIVVGPVAGVVLGATKPETLKRVGRGAAIGLVGGAVVGAGVGQLLWQSEDGRWAGGIIGAATGIVAGSIVGAVTKSRSDEAQSVPLASLSLRLPWGDGK